MRMRKTTVEPRKLGVTKLITDQMREYHASEASRIQGELDGLGAEFSEGGIVRTVLRGRAEQERGRAAFPPSE